MRIAHLCRCLFLLALSLSLPSCGNGEKTDTYTPPKAEGGRMCTNQCRLAEDYCNEGCDGTYRACVSRAQGQALKDYDKYTQEQFAAQQPLDLVYGDFVRLQSCNMTQKSCYNACEGNYGMCYTNCGGKKETGSSCQLFCL